MIHETAQVWNGRKVGEVLRIPSRAIPIDYPYYCGIIVLWIYLHIIIITYGVIICLPGVLTDLLYTEVYTRCVAAGAICIQRP